MTDVSRETQRAAHSGIDRVVPSGQAGPILSEAMFLLSAFTLHDPEWGNAVFVWDKE